MTLTGKPAAPSNCAIHNQTADSVRVDCQEAFDGGLQQTFGLELVDRNTRTLRYVFNNTKPVFTVYGLVCVLASWHFSLNTWRNENTLPCLLISPLCRAYNFCFLDCFAYSGARNGIFAQYLRTERQRAKSAHYFGDDNPTCRYETHRYMSW